MSEQIMCNSYNSSLSHLAINVRFCTILNYFIVKMTSESKPKIVVIGSCSVDFTTYAPRLPSPGETLHGTKFVTSYGGKGANQCVAAAKLGGNAHMICKLGDDQWGKKYKEHLKECGVNVTYSHNAANSMTGIAQISVAENGENQIVIVPGANKLLSKSDVQEALVLIKNADILIGQLEIPYETTLEAFKLNKGLRLLNAAPAMQDIHEIFPYCSILCVNESEASYLTNNSVTLSNAAHALLRLLDTGCETVVITLGEKGAVYATKYDRKGIHVLTRSVKPVDTTGAGDAFVGALATFLVKYKTLPLHQIIGAACEVATISVTREGTQTSYPTDYKPFAKEYEYISL
ncbi:ribokinase-like isoform X2 [Hyposmocoma kahamanoa]|uniref:ribokinase-like isoform X2 n=1 Tax=Hyposmocoma kahamanoa TaxID=1477025 RepID=UPI000E6DA3C8|nr:ribokinase-like isoform X2 [Hyposmocoma kahamanoa]XP_026330770.1 ribokinase-like isoform X2 [Hyposmocoma kahamanoa]XP_026330771.1 ribokinase-like isoform X2 [Hyposmocoma kahamanoa]